MKIDKPGIYRGISEADYRADPCPIPSFTQSLCKVIIERSPKHAWIASPRLNPQFEYDDDTKFDIGNIAHKLVLGRGKEIEVVDFEDWRTKAAKEAREDAADQGRIAVLRHQFDQASEMDEAAKVQLSRHEARSAFTGGDAEVMIAWEEDGIWFRSLIDWLHTDLRTIDDFKTSGMSMAPHVLGGRAEAAGWHIQAAFIERGLDALDAAGAGRRLFRFIGQETDPPHARHGHAHG
ncbi:PD-(D/E)XK nuclease-like domain-containing protein [Bradyrhizobium lablabi]|uniref:PD-(D/E)XK nuclease-like domain-containing protein n=1 Tax=Bradyrhizobium lablabi TaxID=722472 RepID=UPI000944AE16|nr:PD-(D/E)XK nuclease-like domain-containing protein [Bradyrhizobium lablabi]